jgi:hypothetical protein
VKAATRGEILIPRTLHKGGNNSVLCLINLSDHHAELEKGQVLAYAEEVCSKLEPVGIRWAGAGASYYVNLKKLQEYLVA